MRSLTQAQLIQKFDELCGIGYTTFTPAEIARLFDANEPNEVLYRDLLDTWEDHAGYSRFAKNVVPFVRLNPHYGGLTLINGRGLSVTERRADGGSGGCAFRPLTQAEIPTLPRQW